MEREQQDDQREEETQERQLATPVVFRRKRTADGDDLGDDDSFSPDIVSGYHFSVPLGRDRVQGVIGMSKLLDEGDEENDLPQHQLEHVEEEEQQQQLEVDHRLDMGHIDDHLDHVGMCVEGAMRGHETDLRKDFNRRLDAGTNVALANDAVDRNDRWQSRRREIQVRDKVDRATVEQVLDPRTRMILFRLLSKNRLRTLDGCVSTGKEANVYYGTAVAQPNQDLDVAVKVYKTSILQFKDRERYVAGEFRFRRGGYQRGSNRKMVQQWAEKEYRNLLRLTEANVLVPQPLILKPPVLVMTFFGKHGWPAPRLKDAQLTKIKLEKSYNKCCLLMRRMFKVARLVHGDLSEYNLLYWKGDVVVIDVSQSVEHDHPMALDFLRRDCVNVNDFFRKSGIAVLGVRELFDFITGEHVREGEEQNVLSDLMEKAEERGFDDVNELKQEDEVFIKSYIPRTLHDVVVRDKQMAVRMAPDEVDGKLYAKLTGLSIAQRKEVDMGVSKSSSMSEGSHSNTIRHGSGADDREYVPNLEDALAEPATTRFPSPEKPRLGSSSSCTSNSTKSWKPSAEEVEVNRYPRSLELSRRIDAVLPGEVRWAEDEGGVEKEDLHQVDDEEDIFPDNDSVESADEVWIRRKPAEPVDPYMGLTKKEWKKKVKAENRERRETKVPKHVKKRKETLAKRRRAGK